MIKSDNPGIREAIQTIKEYGLRRVARATYEAWLKEKRDQYAMDKYIRVTAREEGLAEGRAVGKTEGEELKLIQIMIKKVQKNKSLEIIAEELEEQVEDIRNIYDLILECAPEYDSAKILEKLHK